MFAQQSVGILQRSCLPPWLREIVREELQHGLLLLVPRSLPPQPVHKLDLTQRKVEQTAIRWVPLIIVHVLIPSNNLKMDFLWSKGVELAVNEGSNELTLTIVSVEQSHTNTPNALASHHLIFPPVAATEADRRRSWLSLWKAQIMSL